MHGSRTKDFVSHACGIWARTARGSYLVFIDGDCIPRRHFVAAIRRGADPGMVSRGHPTRAWRTTVAAVLRDRTPIESWSATTLLVSGRDATSTAGSISRRVTGVGLAAESSGLRAAWERVRILHGCRSELDFEAVNGFDARFVGWGDQDVDLAVRLRRLGLRCGYAGPPSDVAPSLASLAHARGATDLVASAGDDRERSRPGDRGVSGARGAQIRGDRREGAAAPLRLRIAASGEASTSSGSSRSSRVLGEFARRLAGARLDRLPMAAIPYRGTHAVGSIRTGSLATRSLLRHQPRLPQRGRPRQVRRRGREEPSSRGGTRSVSGSGRRTSSGAEDRAAARFLDELWVASDYVRDSDRPRGRRPGPRRAASRGAASRTVADALRARSSGRFTFLFVFDYWSGERKNPGGGRRGLRQGVRTRRRTGPRPQEHQRPIGSRVSPARVEVALPRAGARTSSSATATSRRTSGTHTRSVRLLRVAPPERRARPDDGRGDGARQAGDRDRVLGEPRVHGRARTATSCPIARGRARVWWAHAPGRDVGRAGRRRRGRLMRRVWEHPGRGEGLGDRSRRSLERFSP